MKHLSRLRKWNARTKEATVQVNTYLKMKNKCAISSLARWIKFHCFLFLSSSPFFSKRSTQNYRNKPFSIYQNALKHSINREWSISSDYSVHVRFEARASKRSSDIFSPYTSSELCLTSCRFYGSTLAIINASKIIYDVIFNRVNKRDSSLTQTTKIRTRKKNHRPQNWS